jgi:hypothetical protein
MDEHKLDQMQKKTSGFLNEGMRIIKGSLKEAGRLINATADATRLHIEKESNVIGIHREYHRLGVELYNTINKDPKRAQFEISETMREVVKRIQDAEEEIAVSNKKLKHMTVVEERKPKPEKPKTPRVPRKKKPRASARK